jgi:hypothetical protein
MGGVSPETCWASFKYEIKFWYTVVFCWIFNVKVLHTYVSVFTPLAHSLFSSFVLIKQSPSTIFLVCCHSDFKENFSKLFPCWHILIQQLKRFFLCNLPLFLPNIHTLHKKNISIRKWNQFKKPTSVWSSAFCLECASWGTPWPHIYPTFYLPFCSYSKHIPYIRICTKFIRIFIQFIILFFR